MRFRSKTPFHHRAPPPRSEPPDLQEGNYVPMTPLTPHPDLASLGRQVPPPVHMGFRNPLTPPLRRNTTNTSGEPETVPPPVHRNLKPPLRGKHPQESNRDTPTRVRGCGLTHVN